MTNELFAGNWSGIPIILITLILGMALFVTAFIIISRVEKKFTPHIIMALNIGVLMAIMSMNMNITSITLNGRTFPLVISSLFFPVLALSKDVLNEFYGEKYAKALLNGSIITQAMMFFLMFWFVQIPSETVEMHDAFRNTFAMATRGFIAGAIAMYVGGLANIYLFCYVRKLTNNKMLWGRVFSSTNLGLLLDVILYTSILFIGTRPLSEIFQMMLISAIVRVTFAILEVPVMYLMKWFEKKKIFFVDSSIAYVETTGARN